MKKFCIALIFIFAITGCTNAAMFGKQETAFSSKGAIPGTEPIEYRGLTVSANGANIIIINKDKEKAYIFNGAVSFVTKNRVIIGEFYIPETTLAPGEQKHFKNLFFKGDPKITKSATNVLNWTIYKHEEIK